MLLTLLVDPDHSKVTNDDLFVLYFHQHIPSRLASLVREQALRLCLVGSELAAWNESPFGRGGQGPSQPCDKCSKKKQGKGKGKEPEAKAADHNRSSLRFTDSGSLELLSQIWEAWFCSPSSEQQRELADGYLESHLLAIHKREEARVGVPYTPTRAAACSLRAAAPVGMEAAFHSAMANEDYWRWGTTGTERYGDEDELYSELDLDAEEMRRDKSKKKWKGKGKAAAAVESPAESSKQAEQRAQRFDDFGILDRVLNPLFTTPSPGYRIHHSADPLQGFHLAPAYLPIVGQPLPEDGTLPGQRLEDVAKQEFSDWCDSFRCSWSKGHITLRFAVADALAFAHTLQHHKSTTLGNPPDLGNGSWYRFRNSFDPLVLDSQDYFIRSSCKAPVSFDVIDTSSLCDDLGTLNVLVATSPLLENQLPATLYTGHTLPLPRCVSSNDPAQGPASSQEVADNLLQGDLPTMSLFLGLCPVDYYTNTSAFVPPPTFSLETSAKQPPPPPTQPPPPPPADPSSASAAASTSAANPSSANPATCSKASSGAVYFNQRLTWKRPVCRHPTDGSGKEWTIKSYFDNLDTWPGPSPKLRKEMEEFVNLHRACLGTAEEQLSYPLEAFEAEELEEATSKKEEKSQKKAKKKNKKKGKGKAKAEDPPGNTAANKATTTGQIPENIHKPPLGTHDDHPDFLRKKAEEILQEMEAELRAEFRAEEVRWERKRTEMPLPKIGFEAEELAEFLVNIYLSMFVKDSKGSGHDGEDDDHDHDHDGEDGDGNSSSDSSVDEDAGQLLTPRNYNRATFAALLRIIQNRVVVFIGNPREPTNDDQQPEKVNPAERTALREILDEIWERTWTDLAEETPKPVLEKMNWNITMGVVLQAIQHPSVGYPTDAQEPFKHELMTVLHHFGVYHSYDHAVIDPYDGQVIATRYHLDPEELRKHPLMYCGSNWTELPSTLAVTVRIPRNKLGSLKAMLVEMGTDVDALGGARKQPACFPVMRACIGPPCVPGKESVAEHIFTALQIGFGELTTEGNPFTPELKLEIKTDDRGWEGESDLFVSFMAPTSIVIKNTLMGLVSVEVVLTLSHNLAQPSDLSLMPTGTKMHLKLFEAMLGCDSLVCLSQHMPNQRNATRVRGFAAERPQG